MYYAMINDFNEGGVFEDYAEVSKNKLMENGYVFNLMEDDEEYTTTTKKKYALKAKNIPNLIINHLNNEQDFDGIIFEPNDELNWIMGSDEFDERFYADKFIRSNLLDFLDVMLFVKEKKNDVFEIIPNYIVYKEYLENRNYIINEVLQYNIENYSTINNDITHISYDDEEKEIINEFHKYVKQALSKFNEAVLTVNVMGTSDVYRFNVEKDQNGKLYYEDEVNDIIDYNIAKNFKQGSVVMVNVPTDSYYDKGNNEVYREVYSFMIGMDEETEKTMIFSIDHQQVANSYSIDPETGDFIGHPQNFIYCDFNGNKLMASELNEI